VNRISSPLSSRWAIVVLAVATLALAGCGRKGPLDLPPNTSTPSPVASTPSPATSTPSPAAPQSDAEQAASKPSVFDPSYGADAPPAAAKGTKKPFLLDPLLGN
jgi:predicted small lipoprotein YifL